jgi:hypothetical protein
LPASIACRISPGLDVRISASAALTAPGRMAKPSHTS